MTGIKALDVMLVRHGSRFHGLTPEGETVLEWARRMLGDTRAMRQELHGMRAGLSGHLRFAVIPTALPLAPELTNPCLRRHPALRFTILSRGSAEVLQMPEGLEVDAGIAYVDGEALGRVRSVPLYVERYRFITTAGGVFGDQDAVTWADLARAPLCLLTPDMQNRRFMDRLIQGAGVTVQGDGSTGAADRPIIRLAGAVL